MIEGAESKEQLLSWGEAVRHWFVHSNGVYCEVNHANADPGNGHVIPLSSVHEYLCKSISVQTDNNAQLCFLRTAVETQTRSVDKLLSVVSDLANQVTSLTEENNTMRAELRAFARAFSNTRKRSRSPISDSAPEDSSDSDAEPQPVTKVNKVRN